MYDTFSADYDRFVNWAARLETELSFILGLLRSANAHRVLDVACGTGMHAIALAQHGYTVIGTDLSAGMIERARANAAAAGVWVTFENAGFGDLHSQFGKDFDAVLCLGNSLPHLLARDKLREALADMVACLRPGGLFLTQNRNFDRVLARRERWMEPQSHREGEREWLFLRFYDFELDGTLTFNIVRLEREGNTSWQQQILQSHLRPFRSAELRALLEAAGLTKLAEWGNMQGAPFDPETSPDLILAGQKSTT